MWDGTQFKITKARGMMIYDIKITNDTISYRRLLSCEYFRSRRKHEEKPFRSK